MIVSLWKSLRRLSAGKKSTSSFVFTLRYCKDIVNLLFWVLWECLAMHTQSDTINLEKTSGSSAGKKPTMIFWKNCKYMQSYFGYFRNAWLHTFKIIILTWRRLWCLSSCQKYTSSFTYFLSYYILKNPAIRLGDSILAHNLRPRNLLDMG